jgi:hypothetical protein
MKIYFTRAENLKTYLQWRMVSLEQQSLELIKTDFLLTKQLRVLPNVPTASEKETAIARLVWSTPIPSQPEFTQIV